MKEKNDRARKKFLNIYTLESFPSLSNEDWNVLRKIITTYKFNPQTCPNHDRGEFDYKNMHFTFVMKDVPVKVMETRMYLDVE